MKFIPSAENPLVGKYIAEGDEHAVLTGPIVGDVTLQDGTRYNVSDYAIGVQPEHADEVRHLIAERFLAEGHPHHNDENPFAHTPLERFADYTPHPDNTTLGA